MNPPILVYSSEMKAHACRFPPESDFVQCIQQAAAQTGSTALCFLTCVGSLSQLTLRMANASAANKDSCYRTWEENLEIVSVTGTIACTEADGRCKFHIHVAVADATGSVFGGHLVSGTVHTTAEVVLGSLPQARFDRVQDPSTGFRELSIHSQGGIGATDANKR